MAKKYPSDVTDAQWNKIKHLFEVPRPKGGKPREHSCRSLLNAIFYVMKEGISWRALPDSFPSWQTVFSQRRRWTEDGTLQRAMGAFARAWERPSASSTLPLLSRLMVVQVLPRAATNEPKATT